MTDNKQKKYHFYCQHCSVIVIVIAINVISDFLYFKADLTSEIFILFPKVQLKY